MRLRVRASSTLTVLRVAVCLALALGCSAVASTPDVRSCESASDCYAVSPDDPFACWRCDKSLEGGTCVAGKAVAPVRTLELAERTVDRMAAFTAAGKLTVIGQQTPAPGRGVRASVAARFRGDLEREAVPLLSEGSAISQLAVAGDWCLAVDHFGVGSGYLCLAPCDASACQPVCETCSPAARPALAVQQCHADSAACEKLVLHLDTRDDPAVVAHWIADGGNEAYPLELPAALDPACAPVVLRAQREDQTRFVVAAAQSGSAEPWLGLVAASDDGEPPEAVSGQTVEPRADARLLDLAGAAAEGDDAQGDMLFAWLWRDGGAQRLSVARATWRGADTLSAMSVLYEQALSGEGRVSVAYAHYGLGTSAGRVGEGGWVVAFRDGARAFALRVDRSQTQRSRSPRELTGAGVGDFLVAQHPAGANASSPFVYVDRVDMQARVLACKP